MATYVLNARDFNMLSDIGKCRLLTINQIRRLYFSDTKWYVYRRLHVLRDHGLITTRPLMGSHGKEGTCIYLTEKGAREVGLDPSFARNHIITHLQQWRVRLSEIYVQLKPLGWDWKDSREVKAQYDLKRKDTFGGLLIRPDGERFFVYLTGPSPQPETIAGIKGEIARNLSAATDIRNVIIFTPHREALRLLETKPMGAKSLFLLKHPEDITTLAELTDPFSIINVPELPLDDRSFTLVHETFAQMLVRKGERKHYLTELLTRDQAKIYHLERYSYERATQNNKRGVIILVNKDDLTLYREEIFSRKVYPHFQFVALGNSWPQVPSEAP